MITYKRINIFTANTEALVNPVNCFGAMGKGLALEFKQRYPANFEEYKNACKHEDIAIGKCHITTVYHNVRDGNHPKHIINFPTKYAWRNPSELDYISSGLDSLINIIETNDIISVAIPKLGCGLGGLNWIDVRQLIEEKLTKLIDVDVVICEGK